MTFNELLELLQTARWFSNLGQAPPGLGLVVLNDIDEWRRVIVNSTLADFGLPYDAGVLAAFPFGEMPRLPTAHEETDPIHGDSLIVLAQAEGREPEFKAARLQASKAAAESQRGLVDSPILKVEGTDLNQSARSAGKYASRMAASEIVAGRVGLWCRQITLYHQGNWPFGLLPNGDIVLL
ncbi:MAG: hypothetical protein K8R36_05185 [Planctomycetales bacterium]|nr:hypothetical protein [Planctomycetales bacterium]